MNRLKAILTMWVILLTYLALTNHGATFNGFAILISFVVVVIVSSKIINKPNDKEKRFMDKITEITKTDNYGY